VALVRHPPRQRRHHRRRTHEVRAQDVNGGARIALGRAGVDYVKLLVTTPGEATVRVAWSPYWRAAGACVERDGDWTRVIAHRPGPLRLTMHFAPARVVEHGRRCA
jgi:hypothetical protein